MKLAARQIESFLTAPPADCIGVLLYGPDSGLAAARSKVLLAACRIDGTDPFSLTSLEQDRVLSDTALLPSEMAAFSFASGPRGITLINATDKLTPVLKEALFAEQVTAFLIITAGELPARSSLRLLAEGHPRFAALPCYEESAEQLTVWLRHEASRHGLTAEPGAYELLAAQLSGGRLQGRMLLEQVMLYLGAERQLSLETARLFTMTQSDDAFDPLVLALADGHVPRVDNQYRQLITAGIAPAAIIRALQNHFLRLLSAAGHIQAGHSIDEALNQLRPPVFFKQQPRLRAQLQRLSPATLAALTARLTELDQQIKQEYRTAETLLHRAILVMARQIAAR